MFKKIFILIATFITLASSTFAFDMSDSQIFIDPNSSPEVQAYTLSVAKKIIANFQIPQTQDNLATVVIFTIDSKGHIKNYEVSQSSGNKDYDNRVTTAVKKSAPYPTPSFQDAEEVGVVLNMDLSVIKLIKMLSEGFDPQNLQIDPQIKQQQGKKFVNPNDYMQ